MSQDVADTPEHRAYVEKGGCAYVTSSKTWCNGDVNHRGPHWALYLLPPPSTKAKRVTDGDWRKVDGEE